MKKILLVLCLSIGANAFAGDKPREIYGEAAEAMYKAIGGPETRMVYDLSPDRPSHDVYMVQNSVHFCTRTVRWTFTKFVDEYRCITK